MQNKVQLITYADRLGKGGLDTLKNILHHELSDLFGGVHVLPFFDPIDGSDAGFDPVDHTRVDPRIGSWQDLKNIAETHDIMADLIVNHMSCDSPAFIDVLANGQSSPYFDIFLKMEDVFPHGAKEADLLEIYRPRPGMPFTSYTLADGSQRLFWTTFTPQQIDINVMSQAGEQYLVGILDQFASHGVKSIRLDAAGYAIKRAHTRCFMLPETFQFIEQLTEKAHQRGMEVLVEIHTHYQTQIDIARKVDRVYDFALPPLVLHTLLTGDGKPLLEWLKIAPRNCITVLDTHDGIGIVDVGADQGKSGLLSNSQLSRLVDLIHEQSGGSSREATGSKANNLDLYQVNCTYFDALGRDERKYLLARAIQFFCPGIPQVYYVGLLAGLNDMDLLRQTNVGRDINRAYFSRDQIAEAMQRPVVEKLCQLIKWRNDNPAFDGDFSCGMPTEHTLELTWQHGANMATLRVDLQNLAANITSTAGSFQVSIVGLDKK